MSTLQNHPRHRQIEVDRSGTRSTIRVFGDLDATTSGALTLCVGGLVDGGVQDVVLDLDEVPFCDSSGLGGLLRVHRLAGGRLEVRHLSPEVRHVLVERGLDRVLRVV